MEFIPKNQLLEFVPDTLASVRNYYNLDQTRMIEPVNILQEWVQKQPHLIKKDFYILPLPKLTKDHLRVLTIKINDVLTSKNIMESFRLTLVFCEYLKAHDYVNGFLVIEDCLNINLADILAKINFVEVQQFLKILMEGYGARMVGIHFLTGSKVIDLLIKTLNQFLSPKICSRIHVHNTIESLHEMIDKEILPVEYGGKERSVMELSDDWIAALSSDEHRDYMKDMLAARTDETYRQVDKFNEEYLGMPGSFRTLNVD